MILIRAVRRFGEARPLDAVPAAELRAWLLELRASLAPESIAGYVRGLKAFGNWCAAEQLAAAAGFRGLRRPKVPHRLIAPFSDPELRSLLALADERERALREKARTAWYRRQRGELRIRAATDADMPALVRLARIDSSRPPVGTIILAEDGGEIVAALAAEDGAIIANPFRATAPIVAMLRLRAEQLNPRTRRTLPALRRLRANPSTA